MKWPKVVQRDDENVWVTYAKKQMYRKNNSLNLVIVGAPGIGKSWATLSYLSALDPEFDVSRVFFKASEFLRAIKDGGLKRGNGLMMDEVGVDLNNLSWQNEINRGLNLVYQTLRFRNLTVGLTLPFINFLSKGVRTLQTAKFKVMGWSKKDNLTTINPLTMEFNPDVDKFYYKRLIVQTKGGLQFCDAIKLPRPPKKLRNEYEKLKREFTDKLYDNVGQRIKAFENKSSKVNAANLTSIQKDIYLDLKNKMTIPEIAEKRGCQKSNIYATITAMKKKGVEFHAVTKGKGEIDYYKVIGEVIE